MKFKTNWKLLFISLLAINLVCLIVFLGMLFIPNKTAEIDENIEEQDYIDLLVETDKDDLTNLINSYLKKEAKDNALSYKVLLTERVMLVGTITVFNKDIDLVMTFRPEVIENGDLLLKQEAFTVGQVDLPVTFVLRYINDYYNLPEWVQIDAKKQNIYVYLSEMKVKSDMKVRVKTFNLSSNDLKFTLQVPTK
ncbi:YpmS family protein [Fredinandcohnia sp. 179-A 10B2 NHS]|uniref:YpmS family protein n=1 Tax=Fredinandcohnia sp. 179-A 10B2 NHS TaxID=3235176 RepID=UPI0039A23366